MDFGIALQYFIKKGQVTKLSLAKEHLENFLTSPTLSEWKSVKLEVPSMSGYASVL
jgi:hypothetical protein